MKKLYLMAIAAFSFAAGQSHAQVTWGSGGSIGANSPSSNLNVGIGITNPTSKLHVNGDVHITSNIGVQANAYVNSNFYLQGDALMNNHLLLGIAAPSNPYNKIHVHNGLIMISGTSPGIGGPMVNFTDDVITYPNGRWSIEYDPNKGLNFWQPWNPTPSGIGGNYLLLLKDDGKVGIGIDPTVANSFPNGYRLYVRQGILTERLKVALIGTANWSDYVFEPGYELKPLEEVEAFIKQHKHLPGVPSAQQLVDEGGIDMNKMFAKQMEKIEELTLYVIELKKENKALHEMISAQKK